MALYGNTIRGWRGQDQDSACEGQVDCPGADRPAAGRGLLPRIRHAQDSPVRLQTRYLLISINLWPTVYMHTYISARRCGEFDMEKDVYYGDGVVTGHGLIRGRKVSRPSIHTYIHTFIHTCIYKRIFTWSLFPEIHMHTYRFLHIYTCIHTYIHTYILHT